MASPVVIFICCFDTFDQDIVEMKTWDSFGNAKNVLVWWHSLGNILFPPWLPLGCYLPWLDHIKIISNHHAATSVLSTRSVGKFAEKLISCQGHFHYRCWLSLQGCYPMPVTLSTYTREYFQVFISPTKISMDKNSMIDAYASITSTITGSWSE